MSTTTPNLCVYANLRIVQANLSMPQRSNQVPAFPAVLQLHGVQNSKTGYLTLATPLSGKIFLRQGGTCYGKYEVSRFTRYEAVNGGAKCRKWGGLEWLGGAQGQRQCHHSIERIRLPIRL